MNSLSPIVKPCTSCDVLVIGGGPAGSTISALLAEQGWNVHVLEKDSHPRFHIGESLLPQSIPMLRRLGVLPDVEKIGIVKYGAELVSHRFGRSQMFHFAKAYDDSQPYAFEVKRAEFDAILARNAKQKGAQFHEEVKAHRAEFRSGRHWSTQKIERGMLGHGKPGSLLMQAGAIHFYPDN